MPPPSPAPGRRPGGREEKLQVIESNLLATAHAPGRVQLIKGQALSGGPEQDTHCKGWQGWAAVWTFGGPLAPHNPAAAAPHQLPSVEVPSFPGPPTSLWEPPAHGCSDSSSPTTLGQTQPPTSSWQSPDTLAEAREPAGEEKEEGSRRQESPRPQRQVTSTFPFTGLSPEYQELTRAGIYACVKKNNFRDCTQRTRTHQHTRCFIFNRFPLNTRLSPCSGPFSHCFPPPSPPSFSHRASLLNVNEGISHSSFAGMF